MNIFVVDEDPVYSARMLCDQHICKMSIETPQLLSAAHHRWHPTDPHTAQLYKLTHKHHPATLWVGAHPDHYAWTYAHACALWDEYTRRYGRVHKSSRLRALLTPPRMEGYRTATPPPQCMPDMYRSASTSWSDTVAAYRRYYRAEKVPFGRWKHSTIPAWMQSK